MWHSRLRINLLIFDDVESNFSTVNACTDRLKLLFINAFYFLLLNCTVKQTYWQFAYNMKVIPDSVFHAKLYINFFLNFFKFFIELYCDVQNPLSTRWRYWFYIYTLFWFLINQSIIFLLNYVCLSEKQQQQMS
jgi:hypothetical protein